MSPTLGGHRVGMALAPVGWFTKEDGTKNGEAIAGSMSHCAFGATLEVLSCKTVMIGKHRLRKPMHIWA